MQKNNISYTLSPDARSAVYQAIEILESQLGFLIAYSSEEENALTSLGDHKLGFVEQALEVAQNHKHILPSGFNAEEFALDLGLYHQLRTFQRRLKPLLDKLDDSTAAVGSSALQDALTVYGCAKAGVAGESLEQLVAGMKKYFCQPGPDTTEDSEVLPLVSLASADL